LASDGGVITYGAISYRFDGDRGNWSGSSTILSADGTGSLLNLSGLSTFNGAAYSNGGVYAYSVSASNNGVVDLSKVTTLTGAQSDDWLQFLGEQWGNDQAGHLDADDRTGMVRLGNCRELKSSGLAVGSEQATSRSL